MRKKNKIKITVNGKQTIINSNFSLKNLVDKLEIPLNKIAIEYNKEIVDKKRILVSYAEDKDTELWRDNLKKINTCFSQHMIDLRIKDEEYQSLQERLLIDDDKEPIDLSQKVLARIFINNSFGEGGRFYRGWWQNVPSEYRPYITINSKLTQEHDFSQLNPNMIYDRHNLDLGSEDAYDRVLDGKHRDIVKQCFNFEYPIN